MTTPSWDHHFSMMTMTANSSSALKSGSNTFDHFDFPIGTSNNSGQSSPAVSVMSMAPNVPAAEVNIKDKMTPKMPAKTQSTEFSDSDDDEGLPGYPTWGSNWSKRSLRNLDRKPPQSSISSPEKYGERLLTRTLNTPTCHNMAFLELTYCRRAPLNELNHRTLSFWMGNWSAKSGVMMRVDRIEQIQSLSGHLIKSNCPDC